MIIFYLKGKKPNANIKSGKHLHQHNIFATCNESISPMFLAPLLPKTQRKTYMKTYNLLLLACQK